MDLLIVVLILALLFGGLGFVVHALWIVAIVLLVLWAVGRVRRRVGAPRRRGRPPLLPRRLAAAGEGAGVLDGRRAGRVEGRRRVTDEELRRLMASLPPYMPETLRRLSDSALRVEHEHVHS